MALARGSVATAGRIRTTRASRGCATRGGSTGLWLLAASVALGLLALGLLVRSDAPVQVAQAPATAEGLVPTATTSRTPSPAPLPAAARRRALDAYEKLPLSFAPNAGQTDERVRYLAQGAGYSFYFTADGATLSFAKPVGEREQPSAFARGSLQPPFGDERQASQGLALDLRFLSASPDARLEAGQRAAGTVNQLTGAKSDWKAGLPTSEELTYRELWPGIDMVFRGQAGMLKYEFHLRPGADPRDIRLAYAGANGLSLGSGGSLAVHTPLGELKDARPVSYQHVGGRRVPVESRYALERGGQTGYGFALGSGYDSSQPLVIDPGLDYSTFLGGTEPDVGFGIAVDEEGSAYVTGGTSSVDYPTTPGAYDPNYNDGGDAFVTKLNRSGSALTYSTFLGGTEFDEGDGIAVDEDGSAYVTGGADSADYPTTGGAYDPSYNGGGDVFVTKLNRSGSALAYSTFLGGADQEGAFGIAVDEEGRAYVTGSTGSGEYPTTPGAYDPSHNGGGGDAFVTKLNRSGSALAYSTFLGGTASDGGLGIAVDEEGRAYVSGSTGSGDYPTTGGAYDPSYNGGGDDAFVTKLNSSGSALAYSTFLGGTGQEVGWGLAVDEEGRAYVTGDTFSGDYPTTPGAYDPSYSGDSDAFVTKLNSSGSALAYSTFLGGTAFDRGLGIAVDEEGRAYVTGDTGSADYPTTAGAYDPSHNGSGDAFVTNLNRSGSALAYSTFLGGTGFEAGTRIAVNEEGRVYVTGWTDSPDYPTTAGAYDPSFNGVADALVTKLRTGEATTGDDD